MEKEKTIRNIPNPESLKLDGEELQKPFPEALLILYGDSNTGKTTALTHLVFLLVNSSQYNHRIFTWKKHPQKNAYRNGCYIIRYRSKWIFISTWGDSRRDCELNQQFFYGQPTPREIVVVTDSICQKWKRNTIIPDITPDICITASRSKGESLPPTYYLANKQLINCKWQIWKHKYGKMVIEKSDYLDPDMPIVTKGDHQSANSLKSMIDMIIDNPSDN